MLRSRPSKLFELLVILVVVLGVRAASHADALGSINGTVIASGSALRGASVRIVCGGVTKVVTTDGAGNFSAGGLPAGTCTVTASHAGYGSRASTVTVTANGTASLQLTLPPAVPKDPPKVEPKANPKPATMKPADEEEDERPAKRVRELEKRADKIHMPSPSPAMSPPPPPPPARPAHGRMQKQQIAGGAQPQPLQQEEDIGHNTEAYSRIDDNPFLRTSTAPLSTFSSDVDTASYSNLRRFLRDGQLPPKDAVRIEELINYFHYDYPAPAKGDPFSISTEVVQSPWTAKHQLVRIGIKAPAIDDRQVPARNLVFLLDVSGSMQPANKLPLLKQAMGLLVETLRPQDKISIAVYAGASGLALKPTSGRDKDIIRQALFSLEAGGSTNGAAGIQLAYNIAEAELIKGGINRVILCTDGDFNVGVTSEGDLTRLIEKERERGVFLTVLGFGMGNTKDATMEKLADRGNGNYAYIDSISEARKVLVQEAGATLNTVAKDVKLQIEFNPALVAGYRLIGYENRLLRDEDFNDDKKDAGDIGAGHSVTALYEIVPAGMEVPGAKVDDLKYQNKTNPTPAAGSGELMTVKVRYKAPDGKTSKLMSQPVKGAAAELAKASGDFQWAAAIAGFGMMLRESPHRGNLTWKQVQVMAEASVGKDAEGYRKQAVEMIKAASKLKR